MQLQAEIAELKQKLLEAELSPAMVDASVQVRHRYHSIIPEHAVFQGSTLHVDQLVHTLITMGLSQPIRYQWTTLYIFDWFHFPINSIMVWLYAGTV